jgi:hypothetical protein
MSVVSRWATEALRLHKLLLEAGRVFFHRQQVSDELWEYWIEHEVDKKEPKDGTDV